MPRLKLDFLAVSAFSAWYPIQTAFGVGNVKKAQANNEELEKTTTEKY